jgi:hypothetical protein
MVHALTAIRNSQRLGAREEASLPAPKGNSK